MASEPVFMCQDGRDQPYILHPDPQLRQGNVDARTSMVTAAGAARERHGSDTLATCGLRYREGHPAVVGWRGPFGVCHVSVCAWAVFFYLPTVWFPSR